MARNKSFWFSVLWTLFITVSCLITANSFSRFERFPIPHKDKIVHFVFYLLLVFLWNNSLKHTYSNKTKLRLYIFLGAVFYGALIELCQRLFTTTRNSDFTDIIANTSGAAVATLLVWLLSRNK